MSGHGAAEWSYDGGSWGGGAVAGVGPEVHIRGQGVCWAEAQ